LVAAALEQGVTVFDTADVYGSGNSERVLGKALRGRRDDVVLATKAGYVFRPRRAVEQVARRTARVVVDRWSTRRGGTSTGGAGAASYAAQDFSPDHLRAALDASLRRLQTDHVDVFQLHGPHEVQPELLAALDDLVRAGKVGRFGVGAEDVDTAAAWTAVEQVAVVQLPFGILDPEAAATVLPRAEARSVQVWARGVLGGGVLKAVTADPEALAEHPKRQLVGQLMGIARDAGIGIDELAVGFVRAQGEHLATILIGTSSPEHLARSVRLMQDPPLPTDVLGAVAGVLADDSWRERRG
jgi:aryl-alcohol dehydrogenase-like predicted oxidoreductase